MKKFFLTVTAILIAFNLILPPHVAEASIATKPLAAAAKKALKEITKDSAIEMAEHIAFEFAMNEFINGPPPTEQGYEPVCLDGKTKNYDQCPDDKKAQVKKNLTANDKNNLSSKIEDVIEKKTKTDTRMGKFLDFFVPLFLISGAIAWIESELSNDDKSLIDDIALTSLEELGIIKPLNVYKEVFDYTPYIESASVSLEEPEFFGHARVILSFVPKQQLTLKYSVEGKPNVTKPLNVGKTYKIGVGYQLGSSGSGSNRSGSLYLRYFYPDATNTVYISLDKYYKVGQSVTGETDEVFAHVLTLFRAHSSAFVSNSTVNSAMNNFFGSALTLAYTDLVITEVLSKPQQVPIDLSGLKPSEKSNYVGDKVLPGQKVIPIKIPDGTRVFPKDDGTWTDTEGNPIDVNEDTLIVEDVSLEDDTPPDDDKPPSTDEGTPPDKDKNKKKLEDESKKLGNLVTTRFPFSLPWDFIAMIKLIYADPMTPKWEVRGTDKIPLNFDINLSFLDPYISWFRGFILIGFVISVIFMHGRFMGGSQ